MAKVNPNKHIQKPRTEDEMRKALHNFCDGTHTMSIPPQVDDDDVVLSDAIAELIEARQTIADVHNFAQRWMAKDPRR